ncbi:SRPBCC domain-containing protein [Archangium violaceum]|uniref:SRPBCC domain-containing protein n=1 Tax=Archangium violaceum TaxID=83451 RepID=UPI001950A4DE|nr:SRPBCC domain-containing protein [Archangium violaceum]QRN99530.1 SRPBCC domain-containing protein [Archangium violaceum]
MDKPQFVHVSYIATIEQTPTVLRLVVTHEGFEPGSKGLQQVTGGWQAILSSLKTLLETGKPLDFSWWRG